jgi:hypothetical protein
MRVRVTAKNDKGTGTAVSATTAVIRPALRVTATRPSLHLISARFLGATIYVRFRVCDNSNKNLTIIARDSSPGKLSYTRRFSTLAAPAPCGVYTRHWAPVARFRTSRYTMTLTARNKSGKTSAAVRRTFARG